MAIRQLRPIFLFPLWLVYVMSKNLALGYEDMFEYPFVTPDPRRITTTAPAWQHFYPPHHDFTDYSQHITRTGPASRNSAGEEMPSGPYFAQELKNIYHKRPVEPKIYQTSWNMIDSDGNEVTVYNRPVLTGHRLSPPTTSNNRPLVSWQGEEPNIRKPIRKKPTRKKNKIRPIHPAGYQQHLSKVPNKHPNDIDKISDGIGAQSIASAYPNGVMGTLSLMAGLVWYLVNKSATPVVKMRQHSDSSGANEDDPHIQTINQVADYWLGSLKLSDCQQRAVCELVSQSAWLSSATQWTRSVYQSSVVQKTMETLKEEDDLSILEDQSKLALIIRAASDGERGVDCAAVYPQCLLPFRNEARDRRR